jgi:hypothetical protein
VITARRADGSKSLTTATGPTVTVVNVVNVDAARRQRDRIYRKERIVDRLLSSTYPQHRREGVAILNILNLVKQTEGLRESLREYSVTERQQSPARH